MNTYKKRRYKKRPQQKKEVSTIDPSLLIKKAKTKEVTKYESKKDFSEFKLSPALNKNIVDKGYLKPTEIQEKSIDCLIQGKNLIGVAATGTGKTAAFLIPIIERLSSIKNMSCLIVLPTRELAEQVNEEFISLTKQMGLRSACFIGGTNVNKDIAKAKSKNQLIIGTPGRLNDLMERKALRINRTSMLVLDEFDRMLDMGFINAIRKIIGAMKERKQTMLFSATKDDSAQEQLIKEFVNKAERVNVSSGTESSDNVEQDIIKVLRTDNKFDILVKLLREEECEKTILFTETKRMADKVSYKLRGSGLKSDVIHGNKSQNYRSKAIKMFKSGKTEVLVATDVVARGIHVDDVTHVVNYQLPKTMDSYIHRIGRAGRAGKKGMAYTFVDESNK